MTTAELATFRVPNDPASPPPMGGYVMVCAVFYERDLVCHHIDFSAPCCNSMA
jgi:hypothetical protein